MRWGNRKHKKESSTGQSQFHLEAVGKELKTCCQVPVAVQPFESLQALQTDFSMLLRKTEVWLTTPVLTLTGPPYGSGCPLILRILRYLKDAQLSSYLKKKKEGWQQNLATTMKGSSAYHWRAPVLPIHQWHSCFFIGKVFLLSTLVLRRLISWIGFSLFYLILPFSILGKFQGSVPVWVDYWSLVKHLSGRTRKSWSVLGQGKGWGE